MTTAGSSTSDALNGRPKERKGQVAMQSRHSGAVGLIPLGSEEGG